MPRVWQVLPRASMLASRSRGVFGGASSVEGANPYADLAALRLIESLLVLEIPTEETPEPKKAASPRTRLQLLPARLSGGGYGLTARAIFF
jgi:hypothetical protein